ncbi:MAG: twin-arginine translocation signal domain-containing protein [Planctomycetota bacterium]|jgi:hypothetical protein
MSDEFSRRRFVKGTAAATLGMATGLAVPTIVKAAASDKWGDLVGRFVHDGPAPPRKKLTVDKDKECCGKFDIRDESLMVGEKRGLGNVYIYVRSRKVGICPELEEKVKDQKQVLLENRDCIFIPHCMKIWQTKQEFYTTNSQPIADNVAFSPLGDVAANIVLPPVKGPDAEETSATWRFRRPQRIPVPIVCNYHPWESAYILPLDHPYVEITKMDGTFRISKLPVGPLEFQVWHERVGYLETPAWKRGRIKMSIRPGVNDLGTITLPPKMFVKK